ncbi:MAG: hypothetical protein IJR52_05375 [Selenomonadaceae bacterium]|nr:hypothetical protein [Selenomonadaceae bacterium]
MEKNFIVVDHINPYLLPGPDIMVSPRSKPFFRVPEMRKGSQPTDDGNFLLTSEERAELIKKNPRAEKWIRPCLGSREFIQGIQRYCLWLEGCPPDELRKMPLVYERVKNVREFRLNSKKAATRKDADTPTLFQEIRQPKTNYLLIPSVSSERRRYIPIGFMPPEVIASNLVLVVPDADLFHFGILTSSVHMNWMRLVAGRLKSDYRYSATIVYNPFPWPLFYLDSEKPKVEATAQKILDARKNYPQATLADLYDENSMPSDLRKAHAENDAAVMKLYHFPPDMNEMVMQIQLLYMYDALSKDFGEEE